VRSARGISALKARAAALAVGLFTAGYAGKARAEAAPDRYRTNTYYGVQAGALAGLFGGSIALKFLPPAAPGPDPCWFPGDFSLRGEDRPGAAKLSDALIAVTIATPVAAALGKGASPRLLNFGIVYGETLGANLLLNTLSKAVFGRPRPYTYRYLTREHADSDWFVSFYSGHSSTSFAAAVSGSYLFAESAPDRLSSVLLTGVELTLASTTAVLRTRAGKHYYSDIIVGAVIGTGLGIGIPVANGARYKPRASELIAAGGGVALGTTLAALLPFDQALALPHEKAISWQLVPAALGDGAVGMSAVGTF
jgi:membrane-associated phospholipid phosphatase